MDYLLSFFCAIKEVLVSFWVWITTRTDTFWTAMSVLTTLFLSVVALWKEQLRPQPNLILEESNFAGKAVPLNGTIQTNSPLQPQIPVTISSYYYHARVRNLKRGVMAKNVMVLCNRKWLLNESGEVTETVDLHPPRSLTWSPREANGITSDISSYKYLDLIRVLSGRAEIELFTKATTGEHLIEWGQNTAIELEIVADNISKIQKYRLSILWLKPKYKLAGLQPLDGNITLSLSALKS